MKKIIIRHIFFTCSLATILVLSFIDQAPFYGKSKFIFLNTYLPYFAISSEIIEKYPNFNDAIFFKSDPVTEYSIFAAFGIKTNNYWRNLDPMHGLNISISSLFIEPSSVNSKCIINLKGFSEIWVPSLTGHWDPVISNTARFYEHNGYSGKKLSITIENQFKDKCIVLKDKELPWKEGENFRYLSPNLNYTQQQEDVHILQFKKGNSNTYNILIDVGQDSHSKEKLLDYLAINEIYSIDEIFISHPHKDHYSGLYELLKFGIPIRKVWMNLPLKENCDREIPWGCDYLDLRRLVDLLKEKGIEHKEIFHINPNEPLLLYSDSNNKLSLLFASPPVSPQQGNIDINDLSMLIKLETNGMKYLFTGDLNNSLSEYLKENLEFQADFLKVPHHGTEGVASNGFFDTVGAKIGIVPSPRHLWCSDRSSRIRNYFKDKRSRIYVSGFHGDILIRHFENKKYEITTELEPLEICGERIKQSFW